MRKLGIHVVYEHGATPLPHGSAYVRLLRPLTHPALAQRIALTAGPDYHGTDADAVIVDRAWCPEADAARAAALLERAHHAGARLLYAIDDDLLLLPGERKDWSPTEGQLAAIEFFLRQADGVLVTTDPLREMASAYNAHVCVVPNLLDDRLIARVATPPPPLGPHPVVIGYMGTRTHDDDLRMVLPALEAVAARHPGDLVFEVVGGACEAATQAALADLGFRTLAPASGEDDYALFMLWFGRHARWDIGLAPLRETVFAEAKSDIKFLDYSALGAATLCSDVPAYAGTVRHGETGLRVENTVAAWEAALETLIAQPGLRRELAANAWRYLLAERTVASAADGWLAALDRLLN